MEPTAGLYIAYEIAKGLGAVLGADKTWIELSERIVGISKILQESSSKNPAGKPKENPDSPDGINRPDGAAVERVAALLILLARSKIRIDLRSLRQTLRRQGKAQGIGDVVFICADTETAMPTHSIRRLDTFSALRESSMKWNVSTNTLVLSGVTDRSGASKPGSRSGTIEINRGTTELEIADSERL